ncbi:hypothetical protein EI94DRAFT_1503435, partial [Lactarius quietus]
IIELRNGGLVLQFNMKSTAEWFSQTEIELTVLRKFDSTAILKDRTYQILVPRIPVTFELTKEESLCELEELNNLHGMAICKACWIKPIYRRTQGQHTADLAIVVSSSELANILI